MKTSVVKIFAGSGIRLAVLSVLFLGMTTACMAQASAAPAQPAAPAAVAPQAQPVAQGGQTATPSEPAAKGTSEGIQVHGHWTLEVKNPDGKLVTHREFENSLVYNGGALLLPALLNRNVVSGAWEVQLADTAAEHNVMFVVEPSSSASVVCPSKSGSVSGVGSCSNNLALVNNVSLNSSGILGPVQPLTLSGSSTIPSGFPSAIGYVVTVNYVCASDTVNIGYVTTQACFNLAAYNTAEPVVFTTSTLDGLNGDPAAVPVSAGQTIAVTIVISFQ